MTTTATSDGRAGSGSPLTIEQRRAPPRPAASTSLAATSRGTGHAAGRPAVPASRSSRRDRAAGGQRAGQPAEQPGTGAAGADGGVDGSSMPRTRLSRAWTAAGAGPGEQRPAQQRDGEGDGQRRRPRTESRHGGHQNLIATVLREPQAADEQHHRGDGQHRVADEALR